MAQADIIQPLTETTITRMHDGDRYGVSCRVCMASSSVCMVFIAFVICTSNTETSHDTVSLLQHSIEEHRRGLSTRVYSDHQISGNIAYRSSAVQSQEKDKKDLVGVLRKVFGSKSMKIPSQLILTGKPDSLEGMDSKVRSNIHSNMWLSEVAARDNMTAVVHPKWFGDKACEAYIREHYDEELLGIFRHAHPGYYRGDVCRAAILYREGGFYTDVDVELAVPLTQLVDENTTFMSAYSENGDIFNGLIAAVPKSEILGETLQEIRRWYRKGKGASQSEQVGLMGTMTMLRGLETVVALACPDKDLLKMKNQSQWECGKHTIRLYQEAGLVCSVDDPVECPEERKRHKNRGMRLGLFMVEPSVETVTIGRSLVGWPRFHNCQGAPEESGCGSGGHSA